MHRLPDSDIELPFELPRPGRDAESLGRDFLRHLAYTLGREPGTRHDHVCYQALVLAVRDRLAGRWQLTRRLRRQRESRQTHYLSMEFLMGRALRNALLNIDLEAPVREALSRVGLELEELAESEPDAGLGNGGLGRLAACFMDSCATLDLPVTGYGLRYEYGVFQQRIENGHQVEEPDHWLRRGNPWEIERPELSQVVRFGGHTELRPGANGRLQVCWADTEDVVAVPYDTPIPGYGTGTVNTLRLWKARGTDKFSLREFNAGDYAAAVTEKNRAENLTMVLYPSDESENGKRLRLRQQYFLVSASLQDALRRWIRDHGPDFSGFADKTCFQLNDTHPTVAIPELMRLLMDGHGLEWEEAWAVTSSTMAYTNHTLMPEALERWPLDMFRDLLPRVTEIVEEIEARFLARIEEHWQGSPDLEERKRRMRIIEGGPDPHVRMAHLGVAGSFSVNGVARLHTELLREGLFRDFSALWPERFNSKTNGVTQRRWLAAANPALAALITESIGGGWATDLPQLAELAPLAEDAAFRERWGAVRRTNKERLANLVRDRCGVDFPLDSMFDVQVKRIHEYKRQLLNALHVIHLYDRIRRGDLERDRSGEKAGWTPRCVLIAGKAAPSYWMAKRIIKLIGNVARTVEEDPEVGDLLKVVFLPNYGVSAMEVICPATDLSEQISLAGKEASGTGNMKLMMNGALTLGTLDGANVEILEAVGEEHFFLFGLTAEEVAARRETHDPRARIAGNDDLSRVVELLRSGRFNPDEPGIFDPILEQLTTGGDPWMVTADFPSYVAAQERAAGAFRDPEAWIRSSILNTAASGGFSSDRTIEDYNRDIWHLDPVRNPVPEPPEPAVAPAGGGTSE